MITKRLSGALDVQIRNKTELFHSLYNYSNADQLSMYVKGQKACSSFTDHKMLH